eukprot:SAG11_NODE_14404_length_613_cov_1.066148_1_plen_45_part_10
MRAGALPYNRRVSSGASWPLVCNVWPDGNSRGENQEYIALATCHK